VYLQKYHEKNDEHQEFLDPEDKAFYPTKQLGNHEEISSVQRFVQF
jgi:hypothetical protein